MFDALISSIREVALQPISLEMVAWCGLAVASIAVLCRFFGLNSGGLGYYCGFTSDSSTDCPGSSGGDGGGD